MRREEVGELKVVSNLRTSHAKVVEQLGLSIVGGNPFLESMIGFIKASLDGAFTMAFDPQLAGRGEAITELHLAIVEAIENRDPDGARRATERAIEQGRAAALKAVDSSNKRT